MLECVWQFCVGLALKGLKKRSLHYSSQLLILSLICRLDKIGPWIKQPIPCFVDSALVWNWIWKHVLLTDWFSHLSENSGGLAYSRLGQTTKLIFCEYSLRLRYVDYLHKKTKHTDGVEFSKFPQIGKFRIFV